MGVREEKQQIVANISEKLRASKSTVLVDYRGLDVAQITDLRKQLREAGVDFKVYKNTLARRATQETEMTELDEHLVGPTAMAFSTEDVVAPAKVLSQFAKDHEDLEIKAGVIEGKLVNIDQIKEIASLPSREGLLAMLLSVMQAPIRNFALAVKAVAEQKEAGGGGEAPQQEAEAAQEEPQAEEAKAEAPQAEATETAAEPAADGEEEAKED